VERGAHCLWCDFTRPLVRTGVIVRVGEGARAEWVAFDRPGICLRDRVLSLFAVDRLARPQAYASVSHCRECGAIVLDDGSHDPACACVAG
jgi:hypothetical protein